jgi:hypothetical protein
MMNEKEDIQFEEYWLQFQALILQQSRFFTLFRARLSNDATVNRNDRSMSGSDEPCTSRQFGTMIALAAAVL